MKCCYWNKRYFSEMYLFSYLLGICNNFCMGKNRQFYSKGVISSPRSSLYLPLALPCAAVAALAGGRFKLHGLAALPPVSLASVTCDLSKSHMEIFVASSPGSSVCAKILDYGKEYHLCWTSHSILGTNHFSLVKSIPGCHCFLVWFETGGRIR